MKRIISFVLCLSMLLSLVPVTAFAADVEQTTAATEVALTVESTGATEAPAEEPTDIPETTGASEDTIPETTAVTEAAETVETTVPEVTEAETVPEETEEVLTAEVLTWVPDMDLPSDEELFAGYVEQQFYGTGISTFGTAGRETLDEGHQALYDALAVQIKKIAAGELGSAIIPVGSYLGDLTFDDITYPCTPEVETDLSALTYLDLQLLLDVLLADFPYALYWFDKTLGVSCAPVSDGNEVCYVFYFIVSPDYSLTGAEQTTDVDTGKTGAASAAASNAQALVAQYQNESDYGKLLGYMTEIRSLTSYNYDAVNEDWDYGDPWQLIWVFDGDPDTKVVCEGYSKAFQYLCDQSSFANDILCYSVVGYLDPSAPGYGAHMWNILSVNEGNYLVDVTNTSTSGSLFLKGGTISKGVYYYDYDAGKFASNTEADGTYIINNHKFVYDQETIDLWGMDILTLAAESLTEANFPEAPEETEPSEPETEPTEPEEPTAMTGEELVEILEAQSGVYYMLYEPVVIDSAVILPEIDVLVYGNGSITVKENGSLTVARGLDFANGGTLTVEAGGSLILNGTLSVSGGGTANLQGSYSLGEDANVVLNYPGSISGIETSQISFFAPVWDEASLRDALGYQGYAAYELIIPGSDMDSDGNPDPVVLTKDLTIPENWSFVIGDEMGIAASLQVADGVTLTNNGTLSIWSGASLILGDDATLNGSGQVLSDGSIVSYGTIEGTISGTGTVTEYMSQTQFLAFLNGEETGLSVCKPLILTGNFTVPEGKCVYFEDPGCLIVADGAQLTVEGALEFPGTSLTVQSGSSLTLTGQGTLGFYGGSALTIEAGAAYEILGEAEIFADQGTALTGITKGEVCNSNTLNDPTTNLLSFLQECEAEEYKTFYLTIATDYTVSESMSLPANVVLQQFGNTVTITDGATLTVNGGWELGIDAAEQVGGHIIVENGTLVTTGTLKLQHGSTLTVASGSSCTCSGSFSVDEGSSVANAGTVTVSGSLDLDGSWRGNPAEGTGSSDIPDTQYFFEKLLREAEATGLEAPLTYDVALSRSLSFDCTLVIGEGVTLTVPEGVTLLNNGQLLLEDGATLVVEGALTGRLPALMGTSAVFDYTDGIVAFTQTDLDAQLKEGNGPVHVSIPLILNKDLAVPAGARLILSGDGSITIPAERTLTNNGLILLQYPTEDTCGITAVDGGILANNGTVRNEGSMDLSDGVYTCTEGAELILAYLNQGEGTGILSELLCGENTELYQQVTMLVEGWHEAQMRHVLNLAAINQPKALLINICGVMELNTAWYGTSLDLPEYATLSINAALTLPSGYTLTNRGQIEISAGGTLTVKSGAVLEGNLPVCLDGGQYINENTRTLTGTLENTTLTGPAVVTGTLEIPSGVTLTISGDSASLVLAEGAVLTNSGTINVENSGILDVTQGTYVNNGGTVSRKFRCYADGNITYATVQGIQLGDMVIAAETYSGDQVIREAIDYVDALVEAGSISDPGEGGFFSILFAGETVLSADLELPYYSDPIITGIGSLTVPEGMTLTDHSGMRVAGTLTANGQVIATGFPIMVDSVECLVNPENCTNFYFDDLALEDITVTADRDTAAVGETIVLKVNGWTPEHAKYFGDYEVSFDLEGFNGYGWNEAGNLVVYTDYERGACDVTVTITATDKYGEILTNSAGEDISESVELHFVEKRFYLYITEAPDFYEDVNNGICGLYPGSSLTFYANTTGVAGEVDENVYWPDYTQFADCISTSVDGGMLTITVSEALSSTEVIEIRPMIDDSSVADYSEPLYLRPRATSVDIVMNEQIVSGETVLYDMNRNPNSNSVELMPLASPDASHNSHLTSGRKQLVQWKSSNVNIAEVDQDTGVVTFHKTGKVKITMTANFGSKQTATMTFNVVALEQEILPSEKNAAALIGGSSATYTVTNKDGAVLKSSAVKWFLCDKDGKPIDSHPYASITAAGKLTTKTVANEINVYLMAQVVGDENSACLSEPVLMELYPAVSSVQILVGTTPISGTLLYDIGTLGDLYSLSWTAGPYLESVKSVSWKSSAPKVAEIDANTGLIQVLKPGTAKFTLTITALNNKKTTASVTLKFGTFTQDLSLSALLPDSNEVTDDLNGLEITSGQSITFYAENLPGDVTTSGVKWSVDNKSYATISSKGVLKAKTVVNPVIVTVRVDSKDGACGYDIPVIILPKSTAVIIWNEDGEFIAKTTQPLEIGDSIQLEASEDVTWTSSKPSVADVDGDGCVTALSAGSTTITAATADKRKVTFTLKVTKPFQSISITTKNNVPFTVASGKSLNLVGTVEYEDGSRNTKVTWNVSDSSLATISSSGKLTAAKGLTNPATVYVTATAKDSTWSASKPVQLLPLTTGVEVFGPFGTGIYNVDISNTTQKWDLTTQEAVFSLSARTFPEGAMGVTWKSSNSKIATIDADGNVKCLKAGTVTITATAGDGSGKKASFKLTVHRTMREDSLTLPETAIIGGGKSLTLTKLEGYGIDDEATSKALAWTLTYPNGAAVPKTVASISSKGVLSTKKVTSPVTVLVTARSTDGSNLSASCTVTIHPVTTKISVLDEDGTTVTGDTITGESVIYLTGLSFPAGAAETFTWSSSNDSLATVDENGTVTLLGNVGSIVTITATAVDGSNKKASVKIKITENI